MIRWYIVRGKAAPTARDIIYAPDKASAQAQAHQMGEGVGVISVIEYEEVQRELSEMRVREVRARKIAWDAEMMDYVLTGENKPDEALAKRVAWRGGQLYQLVRGDVPSPEAA